MSKSLNAACVLIVEDDENSLLVTQRLLLRAGVQHIASFHSGAEALAGLNQPVDLALVDIQLPHEDGYSVLRQFRQDERLAQAVVVAFTANVLPHEVQQAREAGFDGLLGKPLNFERFAEQLQQALEGQPVWQAR